MPIKLSLIFVKWATLIFLWLEPLKHSMPCLRYGKEGNPEDRNGATEKTA